MNVKKIQKILKNFAKDRNWEQFHSLKNLAISISIESSELLEHFQWEKNCQEKLKINKNKQKVSDEVADIMLYLLRFSDIAKINIEEACLTKIKKNEKKYPVKLCKGKSIKYTELKKIKKIS
tara:strand:+ start:5 stop:370 length:366 start_codon:yes stop_codon:yes gene_type:complete